jgi:hypothetical protein
MKLVVQFFLAIPKVWLKIALNASKEIDYASNEQADIAFKSELFAPKKVNKSLKKAGLIKYYIKVVGVIYYVQFLVSVLFAAII